jgi:hypothetical protein
MINRNENLELSISFFKAPASLSYNFSLSRRCSFVPRSVFERGLGFVAGDYAAHGLWDKYLAFLTGQNDTLKAAQTYRRILGQPLKELDRYYERCAASA